MGQFIDGALNIDFNELTAIEKAKAEDAYMRHQLGIDTDGARANRYAAALRAIIDRADNGTLGSSKVQDMKRIATDALGD